MQITKEFYGIFEKINLISFGDFKKEYEEYFEKTIGDYHKRCRLAPRWLKTPTEAMANAMNGGAYWRDKEILITEEKK